MTSLDDIFPSSDRVVYAKSPLTSVICQLRFPTILRLEAEVPADFQERVRGTFPLFERQASILQGQIPAELQQMMAAAAPAIAYQFKTLDEATTLSLTPDAIALTTSRYTRWETFWHLLQGPLEAFRAIYKPALFSRVGLRYQNHRVRDGLDLGGASWSALLNRALLGELQDDRWLAIATEARRAIRLMEPTSSHGLLLQHGFAQPALPDATTYILDMDFYTDARTDAQHVEPTLDTFRHRAGNAFRWCLSDELRNAMGPGDLHPEGA